MAEFRSQAAGKAPSIKRRADDVFFPGVALLLLAIALVGFAPSYFFRGMIFAKLPNGFVHIHGALFVSWILLLIAQNALVSVRKIKLHKSLGIFGVILPPLMIVFGSLTLFEFIRRNGPGSGKLVLIGDVEELVLFGVLVTWGLLARRDAASHKRLILATMAIMGPALIRFPFPESIGLQAAIGVYVALPLMVVAFETLVTSTHSSHHRHCVRTDRHSSADLGSGCQHAFLAALRRPDPARVKPPSFHETGCQYDIYRNDHQ